MPTDPRALTAPAIAQWIHCCHGWGDQWHYFHATPPPDQVMGPLRSVCGTAQIRIHYSDLALPGYRVYDESVPICAACVRWQQEQ